MANRNFHGVQINQSVTIAEVAGADIADCRNRIMAYDKDGNVVPAADGSTMPVGVALIEAGIAELEEGIPYASAEPVEFDPETYAGKIIISVEGESDGGGGQGTAVPATPEEIQQVFFIMQMNAEEGAKAAAEVTSENVLILLHAADSRKSIKTAAKKQAEVLFADDNAGEADVSNAADNAEGEDA